MEPDDDLEEFWTNAVENEWYEIDSYAVGHFLTTQQVRDKRTTIRFTKTQTYKMSMFLTTNMSQAAGIMMVVFLFSLTIMSLARQTTH